MKAIIFLISLIMMQSSSASSINSSTKEYNDFVEGALEVYSQFKRPSKEESEKFYSFIQEQWSESSCNKNCNNIGMYVGKKYARDKNVEIKTENQLSSKRISN